jgi:DNA repair protein RAD5
MIVDLPPKDVDIVRLDFCQAERAFYQAIYDRSQAEFSGYVSRGSTMSNYVAIFALLLKLRQACDHPFLVLGRNAERPETNGTAKYENSAFRRGAQETPEAFMERISVQIQKENNQNSQQENSIARSNCSSTCEIREDCTSSGSTDSYVKSVLKQIQEEGLESQECPVCLDPPSNAVLTQCAHLLCEECLRQSIDVNDSSMCPICRAPVDVEQVFHISSVQHTTQEQNDSNSITNIYLSTKLKRLAQDLNEIREWNRTAPVEQKRKVVVFSQWTHMLDLIVETLTHEGFGCCRFDGSLTQEAREKTLLKFAKDPEMEVMVISLRAGGVGLNLTAASVVILMDPWWNPSIENQAIDRVHRIGQKQKVIVKKYVVQETVEDMILELQRRKEALTKNVLATRGPDKLSDRLNLDDLMQFFKR